MFYLLITLLSIVGYFLLKINWNLPPFSLNLFPILEKQFNQNIKNLYSNNGGEFVKLKPFLISHGIAHLTTALYTSQQNITVERHHRNIVETGMTLLHYANMPVSYWATTFKTTIFLINRLPTPILDMSSPLEKLFQRPPNYLKLRTFRCFM